MNETCKHEKIDLVYAKGRCSACGKDIGRSLMKTIVIESAKRAYKEGYSAGYIKATEDAKKPVEPIEVPSDPTTLEA